MMKTIKRLIFFGLGLCALAVIGLVGVAALGLFGYLPARFPVASGFEQGHDGRLNIEQLAAPYPVPETWTHICTVPSYNRASDVLSLHIGGRAKNIKYKPRDQWFGETEYGILFFNKDTMEANVLQFSRDYVLDLKLRSCVEKGDAFFHIEKINTSHGDYGLLCVTKNC